VSPAGRSVVGPVPEGRDPDGYDRLRRRVLWSLPTGLYVLGSRAGPERNLMTVSWVTQACMDPKLVAVGVEATSVTHRLVSEGGWFSLTVLPRPQRAVVRRFVKPVEDVSIDDASESGTMNGEAVWLTHAGTPVLAVAAAWLECRVQDRLAMGSHSLFLGEVADCGIGAPGAQAEDDAARDVAEVLRMEDTRMNYGG
jgi:flavin reductase (DIM6/NTAB) family NADH-FMN oxidoreductase RutF